MTQAPMTAPATVQNFHGKWYYLGTGASGSSEWIGPFDTEAAAEAGQDARVQRAAEDIHAQGATALAAKYAHAFGGSARVTGLRGVNQGETRARGLSVFLWGPSGSWKTTFCCGMPRPFIISVGAEGGDATLDEFPRLAKHFNER
ncbi:MAG: hypothetical protein FJ098_06870, partial [Deltaproteobacteria bacterium]|nr:hypothetical protein [Deltaproteobacteria bacterium]